MCGITGIWGHSDTEAVRAMMTALGHRGPDATGMHVATQGCGVLGHTRLSIMDPGGGDQPIPTEDGSKWIVANGEVYNFPRLARELAASHRLATASDSEAILHLYEDLGPRATERLDGMFAFAIADGRDFMVARDPIGIKPLYYGSRGDDFVFASELKALAPCCDDVHEFPPGTWFHSRLGASSFYGVPDRLPEERPLADLLREIRETLEAAVVKRLMSDVPLGAFLSGGLDSSVICAIARRHLPRLHTFSVGVEGSRDLEAARLVSRHLDTIHHEHVLTRAELAAKLPEIVYYLESFDQDLVRSAYPCYFTSRLAADHVKVVLTGEGADELFAGYAYYRGIDAETVLHRELRRSVTTLHNINLQRVDRMTMAHALEARVPFLDVAMIDLGLRVPARHKLAGRPPVEKWILRRAFEDLLPAEIVWRNKEQFDEGSGAADLLPAVLAETVTGTTLAECRARRPDVPLRSAEEAHYLRLFLDAYTHPGPILRNVARWADRPSETGATKIARS